MLQQAAVQVLQHVTHHERLEDTQLEDCANRVIDKHLCALLGCKPRARNA